MAQQVNSDCLTSQKKLSLQNSYKIQDMTTIALTKMKEGGGRKLTRRGEVSKSSWDCLCWRPEIHIVLHSLLLPPKWAPLSKGYMYLHNRNWEGNVSHLDWQPISSPILHQRLWQSLLIPLPVHQNKAGTRNVKYSLNVKGDTGKQHCQAPLEILNVYL